MSDANESGIVWMDPPPKQAGGGRWIRRLVPLVDRPMQWALVETCVNANTSGSTAYNVRRGVVALPPGKWDATARKLDDGSYGVFVRYLGPTAAEREPA